MASLRHNVIHSLHCPYHLLGWHNTVLKINLLKSRVWKCMQHNCVCVLSSNTITWSVRWSANNWPNRYGHQTSYVFHLQSCRSWDGTLNTNISSSWTTKKCCIIHDCDTGWHHITCQYVHARLNGWSKEHGFISLTTDTDDSSIPVWHSFYSLEVKSRGNNTVSSVNIFLRWRITTTTV